MAESGADPATRRGGVELRRLRKRFGALTAVDDVDLALPGGSFICLLGPSGCGKTTLLRLIAGLETPDRGEIRFDGASVLGTPPHRRRFGMVFQSLALFPHLDVAGNIAYALRVRGASAAQIERRVGELLELVRLPGVGARRIDQLSGGQRQRVAIARALAVEPKLFLLDEPLSALDAKLREAMQIELRQLQQALAVTTVVVTHDQREAMTMADHVVVMKQGRVLQHGAPLEVYRRPADAFVAGFIGASNLFPCEVLGADAVEVDGARLTVGHVAAALRPGDRAVLSVRPEHLHVAPRAENGGGGGANTLPATVTFIRDLGARLEILADYRERQLVASASPGVEPGVRAGDVAAFVFEPASCCVVPA